MNNDIRRKLGSILNTYKSKKEEREEIIRKKEAETDAFLGRFAALVEIIIRPAMDEIGRDLKTFGHNYKITESRFLEQAGVFASQIAFRIIREDDPGGISEGSETSPQLVIKTDTRSRNVLLYGSPGGRRHEDILGPRRTVDFEKVDKELVQGELVGMIQEVLER